MVPLPRLNRASPDLAAARVADESLVDGQGLEEEHEDGARRIELGGESLAWVDWGGGGVLWSSTNGWTNGSTNGWINGSTNGLVRSVAGRGGGVAGRGGGCRSVGGGPGLSRRRGGEADEDAAGVRRPSGSGRTGGPATGGDRVRRSWPAVGDSVSAVSESRGTAAGRC